MRSLTGFIYYLERHLTVRRLGELMRKDDAPLFHGTFGMLWESLCILGNVRQGDIDSKTGD